MIAKSQRWQKTAMAVAATTVLGLWGFDACALSLGRLAVMSALGEPLRAEIEILDINTDEAASLKTSVASPEIFQTAGLEYSSAMTGLQITLQKRYQHGLTVTASYAFSKNLQALNYLNPQDALPSRSLTPWDRPNRLTLAPIYEVPFGPGKPLLGLQ